MRKTLFLALLALAASCLSLSGQIKRTAVPIGDAVNKALAKGSLTAEGERPFHIRVEISEPENPQSPYQGTLEVWWISPNQWRREATAKGGMRQTIIVADGKKSEKDEGDYFPLWLRSFLTAILDPIPNANVWNSSGLMIEQITMPNGDKSDACARAQSKIGTGDRATDAFSNVCFDGEGRLKFYGSPAYSMEFHDYRGFGKKQIARTLSDDPEPGTKLVGKVVMLEDESKVKDSSSLFAPVQGDDNHFQTVPVASGQLERLSAGNQPIVWPTVHSGNLRGRLAVYISVDSNGRVREAWPLNSDNSGLDDSVRDQVRHWTLPPAIDKTGNRVQIEGGLGFAFETKIEDPLPELSDAEVRALATKIIEPVWPAGSVTPGQIVEAQVSVNEQGQLTGTSYAKVPSALFGAVNSALRQWTFRPLIRDGKPQYFHGTVKFTAQ
jgi:hypothetical protein